MQYHCDTEIHLGVDMAVLGLTYATYVALTVGAMALLPSDEHTKDGAAPQRAHSANGEDLKGSPDAGGRWLFSYGMNNPRKTSPGTDGFLSAEYWPAEPLLWKLKPIYGVGVSTDGAAYITAATRRDFKLGPVTLSPYTGPVLYQSKMGSNWEGRELIQFRTGIDVVIPLTDALSLGAGFYHISNAGLTTRSAEIDVSRISVQYKF